MSYEDLNAWKRGSRLAAQVVKTAETLTSYGFRDQLIRSALSIPSNIAEGLERETGKDQLRFLYIAKGSAAELYTQLRVGIEAEVLNKESAQPMAEEARALSRMIGGLITHTRNHYQVRESSAEH